MQVATQVAVLISKVARVGIRDWPELFPALLQVCVHAAENKVKIHILPLGVKAFTVTRTSSGLKINLEIKAVRFIQA